MSPQELDKEKKNTGKQSCCDLCATDCEYCSSISTDLEKLLHVSVSVDERCDQDSSSDATESYDVFDYVNSIDLSLIHDLNVQ